MQPDKAPGPDGLPAEIYQKLQHVLIPPFAQLVNQSNQASFHYLPSSWQEAYISLIPKEGANSLHPQAFRPISLLNVDYKIFMKILADRFNKCATHLIHKDQAGFIPG